MTQTINLGAFLSSAKGFLHMGKEAKEADMQTMSFFLRNPRGGKAKPLDEADMRAFSAFLKENNFAPVVAHAPYTMNPCSPNESTRQFAREMFADDMRRMEYIPGNYYNFHPGSRLQTPLKTAATQIADMLNAVLTPETKTTVLLETMAGKGTEIGGRFEELRQIMDQVVLKDHVGVCLDTCHVWDGGYDIAGHLDQVIDEFDRVIGLSHLKAIHLNDSQNPLGARKDRHARIGEGCIGKEALGRVVCHPALKNLPFYLETPNELDGYAREIEMMRQAWASEEAED